MTSVGVGGADGGGDGSQVFDLLESSNMEVVEEVKGEINETFTRNRENWLVFGLFDYYTLTGSTRAAEILCGISKEPHDKFFIEKMSEGIRSPSKEMRKRTMSLLALLVCKNPQPYWLYKMTQSSTPLFKDLIRLLKTENEVVTLLTGVLCIIIIIPLLPSYVHSYVPDVFDVFGRVSTWAQSPTVPKEHLLHLQVALYSLFHRLYAMYPCNFLSYLRSQFGSADKRTVFYHTIMPMLEKVKMHPYLVTGTKEGEFQPQRWRSKEYHEVVAECSKISLDVYESSFPEEVTPTFNRLSGIEWESDVSKKSKNDGPAFGELTFEALIKLPTSALISEALKSSELTSLVNYLDDNCNTAPPTPLSIGGGPGIMHPLPLPLPIAAKTVSPPETAMEATPENTPVKDRPYKFPPTSPAATQLNFPNIDYTKEKYPKPKPLIHSPFPLGTYTNTTSTPSSPPPLTPSEIIPLTRRDSIFDSATIGNMRRESLIFQRLQKVQVEQTQHQQSSGPSQNQPISAGSGMSSSAMTTSTSAVATVPSKPSVDNNSTSAIQRKAAVPSPLIIPSTTGSAEDAMHSTSDFLTERERSSGQPHSSEYDTTGNAQTEEDVVDGCKAVGCSKGGLHMADHKQMLAFAKRVSRLRCVSQCVPEPSISDVGASLEGNSQASVIAATSIPTKLGRMKRSSSLPDLQQLLLIDQNKTIQIAAVPSEKSQETDSLQTKEHLENPSSTLGADKPSSLEQVSKRVSLEDNFEQPYEQLFHQILPMVLSPPIETRSVPSPHLLLDLCLCKAALLHKAKGKMDEVAILKGQVDLLHYQLLFERHRREAHAIRNRRLAGKCKELQTMEEKVTSMVRQIHNLETEVVMMKQEVISQRTVGLNREKDLEVQLKEMEKRVNEFKNQITTATKQKGDLEKTYSDLNDKNSSLQKELDQKKADAFLLESEIKHLKRSIDMNNELKSAYETSQKEILIFGELLRAYHENSNPALDRNRNVREEMEQLRAVFEDELRGLKNMLDSRISQCEATAATIEDLKKKLGKREAIIIDQKNILAEKDKEHNESLKEERSRYETIKAENHKLDLEVLNLQHQLTVTTSSTSARTSRGRMTSSPSNGNMSPTGNSNSDVDSATSAAGYLQSPDRNPCFFGSPQFDLPSAEMRDIQQILKDGGEIKPSAGHGPRRNSSLPE